MDYYQIKHKKSGKIPETFYLDEVLTFDVAIKWLELEKMTPVFGGIDKWEICKVNTPDFKMGFSVIDNCVFI